MSHTLDIKTLDNLYSDNNQFEDLKSNEESNEESNDELNDELNDPNSSYDSSKVVSYKIIASHRVKNEYVNPKEISRDDSSEDHSGEGDDIIITLKNVNKPLCYACGLIRDDEDVYYINEFHWNCTPACICKINPSNSAWHYYCYYNTVYLGKL